VSNHPSNHSLLSALLCILALISTSSTAAGATDDVPFDIGSLVDVSAIEEEVSVYSEAVVVTGTKTRRTAMDQPFTVNVLDRTRMQDICAKDLCDLLRVIPGLDVHRVNDRLYGAGPPAFANDLSNQLLVLVDGVAYPTSRGGGADWQLLPVQIDEVERIEYVPGPQTTLYGAYAALGVINVMTRRAASETWNGGDETHLRTRIGGDGLVRFDVTAHRKGARGDSTVWASHRSSDGWGDPNDAASGLPIASYLGQEDSNFGSGGVSVRRSLDDHRSVRFDLSYLRSYRAPFLPTIPNDVEEDRQDIDTILTYTDQPSVDDGFVLTLKKRNSDIVYGQPVYGAFGILTNFGRFDDSEINLRRYYRDRAGRRFSFGGYYEHLQAEGSLYDTGEQNSYESSFDASAELPLRGSNSLLLGVNHYGSNIVDGQFTWKAFLRRRLKPGHVLRLGCSTSVRGPDVAALYTPDLDIPVGPPPVPPITIFTGNPYLDVEEFQVAELGYERRTAKSSFQFRLYTGTARNLISIVPNGPPPPRTFGKSPTDLDVLGCTTTHCRVCGDCC